jgi:predicted dehydrogenase
VSGLGEVERIAIIGTGSMGEEYLRALRAMGVPGERLLLVGRNRDRTDTVAGRYGARASVADGDYGDVVHGRAVIVAVTQDALVRVTRAVLGGGCSRVLMEKPGALFSSELVDLSRVVAEAGVDAFVAYNRRFFSSVAAVRGMIESDGGVRACFFEFTEVERLVLHERETKRLPGLVLDRWGLANSTHVIDLAFHLAGRPKSLVARRIGRLPWHATGAEFAGCGETKRDALFSYVATWGSAGRWRVEVTTPMRRIVLCPLETVEVQDKGSFEVRSIPVASEPEGIKPGLAGVLREFLVPEQHGGEAGYLPDLSEAASTLAVAEEICGYGSSA